MERGRTGCRRGNIGHHFFRKPSNVAHAKTMRVALFTSPANDPLSYLIKAVDRGGYVHAALEVEPGTIIESYWPNVRQRALAPQELAGIDFYAIEGLTEEIEARILDYCRKAIAAHETYSVLNLFRFAPEF